MTKREIVLKIADETDLKQVHVSKIIQLFLDTLVEALSKGDKIELRNFGVFKTKVRKAKKGRNPRTNEAVPVPERRVVVFRSGLVMKQKIK